MLESEQTDKIIFEQQTNTKIWEPNQGNVPLPLNEWVRRIHVNAERHGWWDDPRSVGDVIALCHSELSEALEEYRNHKPMYYEGENGKPEGIATELVDCVIRIFDYLGREGVDVEDILSRKHAYNISRPYKHGNKAL